MMDVPAKAREVLEQFDERATHYERRARGDAARRSETTATCSSSPYLPALTYDTCRDNLAIVMMTRDDDGTLPSDAELKLLRELWEHGEQSVSDLHERVQGYWPVGYTTVLKLLQRMTEKRLVTRRPAGRAHLYTPTVERKGIERRVARSFVKRTFDGSIERLLQSALPTGRAREEEIEEIRRLLDRLED